MRYLYYILSALFVASFSELNAQQAARSFSFGKANTDAASVHIDQSLPYTSKNGYGFDFGTAYRAKFSETGMQALWPVYFSIDIPEGAYKITLTLSGKNTETTVKAESKRLMLAQVKIADESSINQTFIVSTFTPKITDDYKVGLKDREKVKLDWDTKLTLEFLGNSTLEALKIEPVTDTKTLFLVGDSTVTNQDIEPWASWGQFITAYLNENIAVSNQASSGASLGSFKGSRMDKVLSQLQAGDYVVIEFGHNDEKIKGEGNGAWGLYSETLTDFIHRIKEKQGIPILITPTQRRSFDGENLKPTHGDFPAAMRKVAQQEDVVLIDLTAMTTQMYEAWGPEGSRKAFVQYPENTFPDVPYKLEDNTHFSNFGAQEVALAVVTGLRDSNSSLKNYIKTDAPLYNPAEPHDAASYSIPFSSRFNNRKPDGN